MPVKFLKITLRNLWKNKVYSFLNIFGLAMGIACTGLIFLWVENETGYDNVNVKKDRLYMALNNWPFSEHYSTFESTPGLMAPAIKAEIPGVANTCRYSESQSNLGNDIQLPTRLLKGFYDFSYNFNNYISIYHGSDNLFSIGYFCVNLFLKRIK